MGDNVVQTSEEGQMADTEDVKTLHARISTMVTKFDKCNAEVVVKLNKIHTDVELIKKTCETRGKTCAAHVDDMDKTLRGNGQEGVLVRLGNVEQRSSSKDKFAYLTIGALSSGLVALGVALVVKLVN